MINLNELTEQETSVVMAALTGERVNSQELSPAAWKAVEKAFQMRWVMNRYTGTPIPPVRTCFPATFSPT